MIATHAQRQKELTELLESEVDHVPVETLEKSNQKYTRKDKSKTNLDRNVEDAIDLDEPDNDLPFRNVLELELVPANIPGKDIQMPGLNQKNTYQHIRHEHQ